jgi:hypothetical protein
MDLIERLIAFLSLLFISPLTTLPFFLPIQIFIHRHSFLIEGIEIDDCMV